MNNIKRYWDKQAVKRFRLKKEKNKRFKKHNILVCKYLNTSDNLADFGCGNGHVAMNINEYVSKIEGIDFSEAMISMAKAQKRLGIHDNINFSIGNIEYTQFENNSKDVVLLSNLLHCVENPQKIISEAQRITKENGLIITSTFCYWEIRSIRGLFKLICCLFNKVLQIIPSLNIYSYKQVKRKTTENNLLIIAEKHLRINGKSMLFLVLKN